MQEKKSLQAARNTWRVTSWTFITRSSRPWRSHTIHRLSTSQPTRPHLGLSSPALPCLFRASGEDGQSQQDFCPHFPHSPPWSPSPACGRSRIPWVSDNCTWKGVVLGKTQGWQAHALWAFDTTGTPRAEREHDGSSGSGYSDEGGRTELWA